MPTEEVVDTSQQMREVLGEVFEHFATGEPVLQNGGLLRRRTALSIWGLSLDHEETKRADLLRVYASPSGWKRQLATLRVGLVDAGYWCQECHVSRIQQTQLTAGMRYQSQDLSDLVALLRHVSDVIEYAELLASRVRPQPPLYCQRGGHLYVPR